MILKLIFKLAFKATLPLIAVVGLSSYVMYAKGGDPAALLMQVAGNSLDSAKSSMKGVGSSMPTMGAAKKASSKTTVYQWVDEHGVTQFGSAPPDGFESTQKTYKNNANVSAGSLRVGTAKTSSKTIPGLDGQKLPGIAGANLPIAIDPAVLQEFIQNAQKPRQ